VDSVYIIIVGQTTVNIKRHHKNDLPQILGADFDGTDEEYWCILYGSAPDILPPTFDFLDMVF